MPFVLQHETHARRWVCALIVFALALAAIFALAYLGRIPGIIAAVPHYDAYGHAILYGLLGYLAHRAWQRCTLVCGQVRVPLALPLTLTIAGIEEALQRLSPLRTASLRDIAWGAVGIVVAFVADAFWSHLRCPPCAR